jgi:hypothetical protein
MGRGKKRKNVKAERKISKLKENNTISANEMKIRAKSVHYEYGYLKDRHNQDREKFIFFFGGGEGGWFFSVKSDYTIMFTNDVEQIELIRRQDIRICYYQRC